MSIELQQFIWPASFSCTVVTENIIIPNSYNINISVEPISDLQGNIANGFKKIRYFVDNYLQDSIFISAENVLLAPLSNLETNVVIFPADPYDFFVGGVLLSKLRAISEKYFDISLITIDSAIGDHVQYCIIDPEECGLELMGDNWWNTDSTNTGLDKNASWEELNIKDRLGFEPRIIKGGRSEN